MAKVNDVAAYICENYPHQSELSKTRLTKLVYLVDWESTKKHGRQATKIRWFFHNFGPYVDDVIEAVQSDKRFDVITTENFYGDEKLEIKLKESSKGNSNISAEDAEIIDAVISNTKSMYWNTFIKHVYDTAPIKNSNRFRYLDLVEFAKDDKSLERVSHSA